MKKKIRLEQLTCPTCVTKIEKAVKSLDGVNEVSVGFNTSTAIVDFNEEKITQDKIIRVIKDLGYDLK